MVSAVADGSACGWGDWQRDTPHGNRMGDAGGGTDFFMAATGQEIVGISRRYFYEGCTIGQYERGYFIADEKVSIITIFTNRREWEMEVEMKNLKPRWWTRWYKDDWHFFDDLLLIMILAFYFTIPLSIIFIAILLRAVRIERLNPGKPCTVVLIGATVLTAVQYYLENNPINI